MIRDDIAEHTKKALQALSLEAEGIHLEHPVDLSHGDFATNVAMVLAKQKKENPKELAEKIVQELLKHKPESVENVEVAGPGFINLSLTRDFFVKSTAAVLERGDKWGSNEVLSGKKIMVEYTDPNPFKEFHIGHLVPNALGESLSRLLLLSSAEVKRANYQGDVGLHVAKAIWALLKKEEQLSNARALGQAYARGAKAYEEDARAKKEIDEINEKIYAKSDSRINELYDKGRTLSLEYFETIYKTLGTKFDFYFFESETGRTGLEIVSSNLGKGVFEESDGAVIFKGEKFGLHTRVFVNSQGLPTYEAKDIGLATEKYNKYPFDVSITVTDNGQREYFKVVTKALEQINPELSKKIRVVTNGILRLTSGKMSSRTGDVIAAESFIDDVKKLVLEKMKDGAIENREAIAEQIAVGAIKYVILKQATGKDIVFDFEKSLSLEGDSGPYLQYTYTRAQSVLRKAEEVGIASSIEKHSTETTSVERLLYRFPEVVKRAMNEYEPHYVTTYLTELAGAFNTFYGDEKILDGTDNAPYKLALTEAVAETMRNGLSLLGIQAPERM